jgi:hypothetical protein
LPILPHPTISEVTPVTTPTTDSTPNYTFTTDEAGTISYGGSCTSGTTSATLGSNTITFTSLADGTYSNCTITVTDSLSNSSSSLSVSAFRVDTSAPVLSSISASVTATTATITWTTDEDSSSSVSYGLTTAYGSDTIETDTAPRVTSHSVAITGLTCATEYNYTVISKDALNYTSSDTNHTFTTSSCPVAFSPGGGVPIFILQSMNNSQNISNSQNTNTNQNTGQTQNFVFNRNLQIGNSGEEVKELQKFLNKNGYTVSITGAGSVNKETTYFGPATRNALIKFQKANNIKPSVGYLGPITRAFILN